MAGYHSSHAFCPDSEYQAPAVVPLFRPLFFVEAAFGGGTGAALDPALELFPARLGFAAGFCSSATGAGAAAFVLRPVGAGLAGSASAFVGAGFAAFFATAVFFGAAKAAFGSAAGSAFPLPRFVASATGAAFGAAADFFAADAVFGAGFVSTAFELLLAALEGAAFTALAFTGADFVALAFDAAALELFDLAMLLGAGSASADLAADFRAGFGAAAPLLAVLVVARTAIACARRVTGISSAIHSTPLTKFRRAIGGRTKPELLRKLLLKPCIVTSPAALDP
ncbi:MAG: hypothetical protein RQ966_09620 [Acetobacteraceae bacterium]|nr:hypothetical protein [Acetobacteraceae bacterium]